MNYGIDIDDTIAKTAETFIEYAKEFNTNILKREYNTELTELPDHFYLKYLFNWNEDEEMLFLEKYGYYEKMVQNVEIKENVKSTFEKMRKNGDRISLITARFLTDKFSVEKLTKEWLLKNNIPYDELIMDAQDKAKICTEKNIDVFVDDSFKNCMRVSEQGIKTYLMTTKMNQNINAGNIQRISNWNEIRI